MTIQVRPFNDILTSSKLISDTLLADGGAYNITLRSDSIFGGGTLYVESSVDNIVWTPATQFVNAGAPIPQTFLAPVSGVAMTPVVRSELIRFNLQGATNPNIIIDIR